MLQWADSGWYQARYVTVRAYMNGIDEDEDESTILYRDAM